MYLVIKNGKTLLETGCFQHACSTARIDAHANQLSTYTIWDKAAIDDVERKKTEKPLYSINRGVSYIIPNPPLCANKE